VTEWKLFDGDNPRASTVEFFAVHPWVPPEHQLGHAQRTAMVFELVQAVVDAEQPASISDLGCGDGTLMENLVRLGLSVWGYDAGTANVQVATGKGLNVRQANLLAGGLEYGELITCSEVIEHMARPHEFVASLPGRLLILSSPSAETGDWHYYDHTWAWDLEGYAALVEGAGWQVADQRECDGDVNHHNGVTRPQRFQAIFATKEK
jgi:hypothetical protein